MRCADPDALRDVGYHGYIVRAEPETDAGGKIRGYRAHWTRPDLTRGQSDVFLLAAGALWQARQRIDAERCPPTEPGDALRLLLWLHDRDT